MFTDDLQQAIDAIVPPGVTHVGFVPTNIAGQFLVAEPNGHPHGVSATFSKVRIAEREQPSAVLQRCLREQVGRVTASVYPIKNVWMTPHSVSYYFAGLIRDDSESVSSSSARLKWETPEAARKAISSSHNVTSRQRDLCLMDAVAGMCLSPYRNVLLMIRELHRLGFERLRAFTYIYAVGTWRCEVVPAGWTPDDGTAGWDWRLSEFTPRLERLLGVERLTAFYTSAAEQRVFDREDVLFMTPYQLALQFLAARPAIACAGYGPDPDYVSWYERTLDLLAPNGVFYAFAEYQEPTDHLYAAMARVERVALPPPGQLDMRECRTFLDRFGE